MAANPFYDFMREVAPGDIVFSFAHTFIRALGVASSHAYESPKPVEFASAGAYWDQVGWRIDVQFTALGRPIKPAEHMAVLASLLPKKYAPLRPNGAGLQSVYLTRLPELLAATLVDLLGAEARSVMIALRSTEPTQTAGAVGLVQWEEHELQKVQADPSIRETDRQAVVLARRGQGLFKQRVMEIERACRVTGVTRTEHLRASHSKPWRDSTNVERLDGENGLLLTPTIDHLFDRGFIGFEDNGDLIVSPVAHRESLLRLGITLDGAVNVGRFAEGQCRYLEFHRSNVLLRSSFLESI